MKCICGLCMAFENFLGLFLFFLRSLIPKKSSGMQKPYVWRVTPPTKNQHKNSILVHSARLLPGTREFWQISYPYSNQFLFNYYYILGTPGSKILTQALNIPK